MSQDKYSALWVSHSSIGDFLKCPRAYFLHNMYKNPQTGRKINIVNPALALGQAVHEAVEGLARFKVEERLSKPLMDHFEESWKTVSGTKGGFKNPQEEEEVKERGRKMIRRVLDNPGPLTNKTVKIKEGKMPPHFNLSEEDNIILCGKIDWLEYIPDDDSIRLIDFKTGKNDESEESLQLSIYHLLLKNLQKRKVSGASYWYLDREDNPTPVLLPSIDEAQEKVLETAKEVKKAREAGDLECRKGGCFACRSFEKIISGEAQFVGVGEYNQEIYIL
jgi:ATP-dependent helicase/DNAse subunit B